MKKELKFNPGDIVRVEYEPGITGTFKILEYNCRDNMYECEDYPPINPVVWHFPESMLRLHKEPQTQGSSANKTSFIEKFMLFLKTSYTDAVANCLANEFYRRVEAVKSGDFKCIYSSIEVEDAWDAGFYAALFMVTGHIFGPVMTDSSTRVYLNEILMNLGEKAKIDIYGK